MDKNGTSRHGACDRCRGQKLRCVGSAQPIANPTSRVLRNAIPCDRCRRAKVDCYSVRPAPRRTHSTTLNPTPPSSERSTSSYTSRGSSVFSQPPSVAARVSAPRVQQDGLLFPGNDQPNDRLSTVQPPMPPDWITYSHEDRMGGDEDLEGGTPPLIGESNSNLYQDPVPVNIHEQNHHTMLDLINPTAPEDWNPDPISMDTYPSALIQLPPSPTLSKVRKLTTLDGGNNHRHGPPSRRLDLTPSRTTATPTRSSIHDLAKLHETLLREKFHREYTLTQRPDEHEPTLNQRSIGQTLHHCQRFVSILKRIRYSRPQDDSEIAVDEARVRGQVSGPNRNRYSISTSTATPTPALTPPTLFSILFCYTSILASYEDIFLSIIEAITRPTPTIPPTLSGLRIDGFELDGHSTLQLECLLNVSHTLLEKVEGLLFGSAAAQGGGGGGGGGGGRCGGGIIQDKLATGLVDMLFEEGDRDKNGSGDGYRGGKSQVRVKSLIQEIQATLSEIDF
ncbi:hypothetical protein BDV36DRAFT_139076 [Aspergillus pseudocaelatus]|uniref:Zn(2)-C6 fungal-type domain-containing protein n=1 Tax=Aspergillus pseudocaelatus TaxID=1825620 RepID=A0ABQ6WQF3_9EURO|nr:hypothetical protein BDV36DRAFT_139076 [Aspergillus pseudocaelatus]